MTQIDSSLFTPVGENISASESISRPSLSYFKDAMRRLKKNVVAIVAIVYISIIILGAVFFPIISQYTMQEQHQDHARTGFMYRHENSDGTIHLHIWGTDDLGRDLFTRVWSGARISMIIGFAAALINLFIGTLYGGISGYFGGNVDNVMMRILEVINGIPYMIVVVLLITVMSPGMVTIIVAYAATGWAGMARLVRGQILQQKEQEYVLASRVLGAGNRRLLLRHLLPNCLSIIIVQLSLTIPSAIFTEAFLSYVGLGVRIPLASWGTLCNEGTSVFRSAPHLLFVPAFFICLTMLSFNLLGDALRDVLDPRLRR